MTLTKEENRNCFSPPDVGFIIDLKAAIMNMFKELMEIMFKELMKTIIKMMQCMKNLNEDTECMKPERNVEMKNMT